MASSVFCITKTTESAGVIIRRLKDAGFGDNDISVLLPDKSGTRDFAHEQHTKAPEGATTGASAGGVLGGTVGLLAGLGALAIPGLGPFIAAGPLLATLSGAALGAAVGGLTGALIGMGIPEFEAKRYEGKVSAGNVLISVLAADSDRERAARSIFEQAGAEDISSASTASTPGVTTTMNRGGSTSTTSTMGGPNTARTPL